MKRTLAAAALTIPMLICAAAKADSPRCKTDSSGKVVAAESSDFNDRFCELVNRIVQVKKKGSTDLRNDLDNVVDPRPNTELIVDAILINHDANSPDKNKIAGTFVSMVEESRVDKQVGAESSGSGTTSLTSKGNVPEILGLAVENGALTQSKSGTAVTFSGNPVGIIKAMGDRGYLQGYTDDDPLTRRIRDFSFSLTFDTSRGNNQGTLTGDLQQVSSYSFRYAIVNHRDPRSRIYGGKWLALAEGPGRVASNEQNEISAALNDPKRTPDFPKWVKSTKDAVFQIVNAASPANEDLAGEVEQVLEKQLFVELNQDVPNDVLGSMAVYAKSESQFLVDRKAILDLASKGAIVTFEYTNNRRVNAPDLSNFKLIAEGNSGNKIDLTGNVAFEVLSQIPRSEPKANRLQDVQASAEVDIRTGQVVRLGSVVLSLSGMYERILNNTIASTGVVTPNTTGDLAIGQFKVTIPVKGSGVKIPLSFSVANRTDLIKETDVRGNFGFTFDLDSIFGKVNP